MMKLNSTPGVIFLFAPTSLASLIGHNWVDAAAFATMAAGFALTGQAGAAHLALPNQAGAPSLPAWRRDSSLLLVGTAILLFGFQSGQALHQAVNNLSR